MRSTVVLLLAMAAGLCAFTHASPTGLPTTEDPGLQLDHTATGGRTAFTEATEVPEVTEVPFEPDASTAEATTATTAIILETTDTATDAVTAVTTTNATEAPVTEAPVTEAPVTEEAETSAHVSHEATDATEEPVTLTDAPILPAGSSTPVSEETTEQEGHSEAEEGVLVEEEGLGAGQVAGIVIGALLAVILVIAVVIAAVRRMGKYSSAKSRKPARKERGLVYSLRRKLVKQEERHKFWQI